jgi:hypothetical protein
MQMSADWLVAAMMVSTVGFGFFRYGKKQSRVPQLLAGLAMMVYPSFVSSPAWMVGIAGAILGAVFLASRAGV